MPTTIFLADDHAIVRDGLRAILATVADLLLVGEAADGNSALQRIEKLKPRVVILDIMLPGLDGLELTRQLKKRAPGTRVVILSMHSDRSYLAEARRAGAAGYVVKDAGFNELLQQVRAVAQGQSPLEQIAPSDAQGDRSGPYLGDPYESLSDREREVLQLTVEGLTSQEIAERLFISPRTVETHRTHILRKLGLKNLKQLIRYAAQTSRLQLPGGEPGPARPRGQNP